MKVLLFLFSIGVGLGYTAYYKATHTMALLERGIKIPAKVIGFQTSNPSSKSGKVSSYPIFKYQVKGQSFEVKSSTAITVGNRPLYPLGEITILTVDPKYPNNFVEEDLFSRWGWPVITGVFSLLLCLLSGSGIVNFYKKDKKKVWLACNGTSISAKVIEVELYPVNHQNSSRSYRITAQWLNPKTRKMHTFYSEDFWYDPSSCVNSEIEVRIDRNNPTLYEMVVPKIPQAA